jgi:signal transduction histidine kinase/ligand-binding sensor domain-containing protein
LTSFFVARSSAGNLVRYRGVAMLASSMHETKERFVWERAVLLLVIALACALLLAGRSANALSPNVVLKDLRYKSFKAPAAFEAMAQSKDGFIWVTTTDGLFRFDGLRFERMDLALAPGLSSMQPASLFAPASGGLWIGLLYGGAVFLKDGHATAYTERDGLPGGTVQSFAQTQDGTLWVGSIGGLARLEEKRWRGMGDADHFTHGRVRSLLVDSAGVLWVDTPSRLTFLAKGTSLFQDSEIQPGGTIGQIGNLAMSPGGAVWIRTDSGLRRVRESAPVTTHVSSSSSQLLFDRDGSLWSLDGSHGIARIGHPEGLNDLPFSPSVNGGPELPGRDRLEFDDQVKCLLEDQEGNVWFMGISALYRFSERNVASIAPPASQPGTNSWIYVAPVTADAGAMWLINRLPGFPVARVGDSVSPTSYPEGVSAGFRSDDGTIWLGSNDALWKSSGTSFERNPLPEGNEGSPIQAIVQDREGAVWVSAVRKGVSRRINGVWIPYGGLANLPKMTAMSLATDRLGRVWFGYTAGRLAMVDGEQVTVFADDKALPIGNVKAIYGKRKGIWAAGEFGLAVLVGDHFQALHADPQDTLANITGLVETSEGDLWINSRAGIVHLKAGDLARAKERPSEHLNVEVFDASDGVQGSSERLRPIPTAAEGTDGRLWFVRDSGLYAISPNHIFRSTRAPNVLIQSLTSGSSVYTPREVLRLPANTSSLHIDYVGLNLTAPEKVRYRYQLAGVDDGWQNVQEQRQAFYTNLAPGQYRFQVIATNGDGSWSDPATLTFVVPPTFIQSGWFDALCAICAAAAVWLLIRLRVRQLSLRLRLRMEERERIARELHDTLLQGTQALVLNVEAAAKRVEKDTLVYPMLQAALQSADRIIAEGRDRIQDLRSTMDHIGDLGKAFAALGAELSKQYPTPFKVAIEGEARTLVPRVGDEAYRIGREALLNAFRHAQATSIEVQLIYAKDGLRLRIRDDGLGLDESAIQSGGRPGHWGLTGMRERAEEFGATFEIWSRPKAGTEIELRVPAETAYVRYRRFGGRLLLCGLG